MARNMRGGARLAAVADLVPHGARVADVGTGHALLPRLLVASGRAVHCVATDRSRATLAAVGGGAGCRAIELRAGDGLTPLTPGDRIDVLVLAGLGARKMIRILSDRRLAALRPRRLVLQPQAEGERLRHWLPSRGYRVVAETRTRDRGRLYRVLAAEPAAAATALL